MAEEFMSCKCKVKVHFSSKGPVPWCAAPGHMTEIKRFGICIKAVHAGPEHV